jgi:tetratricopeptide (TPR) repeat protein
MLSRGLEDEAEALLQKVYDEADDEEPEVIAEEITRIYADYNNVALAKKWFERTGNSDSASKKELKARLLIADGNIEEGQKMLNELIDDDPYNSLYWNLLSTTQYLSDDIEDAITSSEYSLAINPNDEEAILNKANGLYKLGNYEDAIDYYKRFVRIRPDEESGEMMIGISLIALNRVQEGVEYLKKAEKKISIDSTHNDEIYQELVIALSKLNRFDEALAYIKRSESAECEHNEMKVLE